MSKHVVWVGVCVTIAIIVFGAALFLVGNQHKAFRRHTDFYAEFANLDEIMKGAKVRVDGMDAGQVDEIQVPTSPAHKFRLRLTVDDRLHGLIRDNSIVTVETEGVVGDKFLLIQGGSDSEPEAAPRSTLISKEPFEIAKLLEQADGIMKQTGGLMTQANGAIADVRTRLDGALDAVTATVKNTNGVVRDIRAGKGTAGKLLEDPQTAADVQQTILNTRQATANLNTASTQVKNMLNDVQSRQLVAKVDHTLDSARDAAQQLDQTSQQVNSTIKTAFAEDQYGEDAGSNLQQSLTNINEATGNLTDDTEALKHEFFFKGFFKHRGYDNLDQLPVQKYREGRLFPRLKQDRAWLSADALFIPGPNGMEILSPSGRAQIDEAVSRTTDFYSSPLVVEGYADTGTTGEELTRSRRRATLVRSYLQLHFHLLPKDAGVIALSATPPGSAGKQTWDGVCLVRLFNEK